MDMSESQGYWQQIKSALHALDTPAFVALVVNCLQEKRLNFKQLQSGLRQHCLKQVPVDTALQVTCQAVTICMSRKAETKDMKAAVNVFLESVPPALSEQANPTSIKAAATLFTQCCKGRQARIAVKVALTFNILWKDLLDREQCKQLLQQLLQAGGSYTQAASLLQHFVELQEGTDLSQILVGLVGDGQLEPAQKFAASLPQSYRIGFVTDCENCGRLKEAVDTVKLFKLQKQFPGIEERYRQHCLTKLLDKEKWSLALTFAGQDTNFQEQIVRSICLAGDLAHAEEVRQQLGLPQPVLAVNSPDMAAQIAQREAAFLQLALPADAVHFIDTDAAVARLDFEGVKLVGLDVEWKPELLSGMSSPASLLQIASHSQVWVIDLIRLHSSSLLDQALSTLMQSSTVIKLGCQISDDVSKLHRSYPQMQAFLHAVSLLNIPGPWSLHRHRLDSSMAASKKNKTGLSAMAESTLGRPLNKGMQMSDWERRPLSDRQLTYAALDAFVLLQIFDVITHGKDAINQQQLQQFMSTYSSQGAQPSSHYSRASSSNGRNSSGAAAQSEATSTDTHFAVAGNGLDSSTYSSPMIMMLPESAKQASPARAQHPWSTGGELQHTRSNCSNGTQASLVRHDALQRGCLPGAHDQPAFSNLL